ASSMLADYLSDGQVVLLNTDKRSFHEAVRVFVEGVQTRVPCVTSATASDLESFTFESITTSFKAIRELYAERQHNSKELQKLAKQ
ncbi:hypothetical protein BGZ75_002261, partial [Mortierella antarctica]